MKAAPPFMDAVSEVVLWRVSTAASVRGFHAMNTNFRSVVSTRHSQSRGNRRIVSANALACFDYHYFH